MVKKLMTALVLIPMMTMSVIAEITNTVTVTKFHQSYPYSGRATIEYTMGGTLPANAVAEIILNTDDASATFVQSNIVTGANSNVIDFASFFGGALLLTNASFVVTITEVGQGGVQLWANGPYWAECNVGATKPEEYGYYFRWGDVITMGYTRSGGTWNDLGDGNSYYSGVTWVWGGIQMNSSPFTPSSCPTYGKDNATLLAEGYTDSTGNLAALHLSAPWRIPTSTEIDALISNCTTTWITTNGVSGRLVTGTGAYANRSIFLPAAGYGYDSDLYFAGSYGYYWSSTPENSYRAWCLNFSSSNFSRDDSGRFYGQPVRPVRESIQFSTVGVVTYDPAPAPAAPVISPESGTTFASSLTVTISCATEGAAIYYTTDGSEPTKDSTAYRRFKIYGKSTVKAVAYNPESGLYSEVTAAGYALGTCADPVIAPVGGSATTTEGGYVFYHSGQTVTISRNGEEGTIRYTLDGTDPTVESAVYSGTITLDDTTTIKAKVFSDSYFDSEVVTVAFTREWEQVATPEIMAAATFSGSKTKCEIACATEGANICYTLDGSTPTSHSTRYAGAFYITGSCTVKAIALLSGYLNSEVAVKSITKVWGIGDTLGAPDQAFSTSGDGGKAFYRVTDASAPNGEAMHSGDIGDSGAYGSFARTVLSTTVTGPGTVSFSWKASCEDDAPDYEWDHGEFAVDGVVQAYVSGETGWTNVSVTVTGAGEHTLAWTYLKDDAAFEGEDCIWVAGYGWASAEAYTHTTAVPVPYAWLAAHDPGVVDEYAAYEASALAAAANGRTVWACYLLGIEDLSNPLDDFCITNFWMDGNVPMFEFNHTTDGSGNSILPYVKPLGKVNLTDGWRHVPDGGNPAFRFFAVEVVPPGCESVVKLGGVQLWENGPYWAECNVGAEEPWEYGYYFWWGDTVGYTNTGSAWISVKDGTSISFTDSGTAASTHGKDNSALLSAGYIDSTGNLVAAYDAATAHLGSPWRMPTRKEIDALVSNCTTTWITTNGVSGRLVTGKGDFANRSIFLPAAGYSDDLYLSVPGSVGYYRSSTPRSAFSDDSWNLGFYSSSFYLSYSIYRYRGLSVRPVRGFAE